IAAGRPRRRRQPGGPHTHYWYPHRSSAADAAVSRGANERHGGGLSCRVPHRLPDRWARRRGLRCGDPMVAPPIPLGPWPISLLADMHAPRRSPHSSDHLPQQTSGARRFQVNCSSADERAAAFLERAERFGGRNGSAYLVEVANVLRLGGLLYLEQIGVV